MRIVKVKSLFKAWIHSTVVSKIWNKNTKLELHFCQEKLVTKCWSYNLCSGYHKQMGLKSFSIYTPRNRWIWVLRSCFPWPISNFSSPTMKLNWHDLLGLTHSSASHYLYALLWKCFLAEQLVLQRKKSVSTDRKL